MGPLRLATRTSQLAMWQAEYIKKELLVLYPDRKIDIIGFKTEGDKTLDVSLAKIGGKGLFVKELEDALLTNKADIAVHSLKDMPYITPEGLQLAVFCNRKNPKDALITQQGVSLDDLGANPIIGTSSLRRQVQIQALRPDSQFKLLRGNVPTRIQKLKNGEYDAIVLAAAALERLSLEDDIAQVFEPHQLLPAVGQGALTIECRSDDQETLELIAPLNDFDTEICITAERAMNALLGGSCQVPIAGYAEIKDGVLQIIGRVGSPFKPLLLEAKAEGSLHKAVVLGERVAKMLLAQGAKDIIDSILRE